MMSVNLAVHNYNLKPVPLVDPKIYLSKLTIKLAVVRLTPQNKTVVLCKIEINRIIFPYPELELLLLLMLFYKSLLILGADLTCGFTGC
jgi:hypothetical protein